MARLIYVVELWQNEEGDDELKTLVHWVDRAFTTKEAAEAYRAAKETIFVDPESGTRYEQMYEIDIVVLEGG